MWIIGELVLYWNVVVKFGRFDGVFIVWNCEGVCGLVVRWILVFFGVYLVCYMVV